MKYLVYIKDSEISERIVAIMNEIAPSSKGIIITNVQDCFDKTNSFDFAFIGDDDDNVMWMDLMFNLAAKGVGVYLVARHIDSQTIKSVKEASGLSAISISNLEEEIKSVFVNIPTDTNNDGDQEEETESFSSDGGALTLKEFALFKARRYPAVIVSIHGAKGGVGKTCTAVNIATMFAMKNLKTIIVDFDVENGNLLNVLHITSDKDLKDVIKGNISYNDASFEKHSSGLYVMPSLKIPVEAELITGEVCERIIGRLAKVFDVIVIDTGSLSIDPMLVSMQISTLSYIVTTCDMTVVAKTYDLIEDIKLMGIDTDKLRLIFNRVPKRAPLKKSYVEDYITVPILAEIPEDEELIFAINDGQVPIENKKCIRYTKSIEKIVEDIVKSTELQAKINAMELKDVEKKNSKAKGTFSA